MDVRDRCLAIEFILCDVDGVLTDGGIVFNNEGIETKQFHVHDGLGVKLWRRTGGKFGLLTARVSHIVKLRAGELGIDVLRQGFEDKLPAAQQLFSELQMDPAHVCYIGDDLPDLPVIRNVGLGIAVADAVDDVRQAAHYVTERGGGTGAVRESVELILRTKGLWDGLVSTYGGT